MRTIFVAILIFVFTPFLVLAANDVTISQDTTLQLPSDGSLYTLLSGSTFSNLETNTITGSFTFNVGAGSVVDLTSADKKTLANSLSVTTTCETNRSRVRIVFGASAIAQPLVITPSGTCGSSSGGGGGGSPSIGQVTALPAPAPVSLLPASLVSSPPTTTKILLPGVVQPSSRAFPIFNRNLDRGNTGTDVRKLQELLKQDVNIYPLGTVNGVFGPATFLAVQRFQKKYGLPMVGRVGPATRSKLQEIFEGSPAAPASQKNQTHMNLLQAQIKNAQLLLLQEQLKMLIEKAKTLPRR